MTVLGLPLSMFLVFAATILAGSLGAIHFTIVHLMMRRPFPDEAAPIPTHDAGDRMTLPSEAKDASEPGGEG